MSPLLVRSSYILKNKNICRVAQKQFIRISNEMIFCRCSRRKLFTDSDGKRLLISDPEDMPAIGCW